MFELLAQFVLIIHLLFIIFVIIGGFLIFVNFKFIFIHIPCFFWGLYVEFSHSICPLTYLENWLLKKAEANFYDNDFIENYILNLVYPPVLDENIQIILGILLLLINCMIYSLIFYLKFKEAN